MERYTPVNLHKWHQKACDTVAAMRHVRWCGTNSWAPHPQVELNGIFLQALLLQRFRCFLPANNALSALKSLSTSACSWACITMCKIVSEAKAMALLLQSNYMKARVYLTSASRSSRTASQPGSDLLNIEVD